MGILSQSRAGVSAPEEMTTSLFYNEGLPLYNAQDGLCVHLDGPGGSHIGWIIEEPVKGDGWSSSQVETIKGFCPTYVNSYA